LHGVEVKRLNEQVKRNIKRFPDMFRFQLTKEEFANLKSQIATSSWGETKSNMQKMHISGSALHRSHVVLYKLYGEFCNEYE
jgi:hypothetical protein